jgi:hypothetical protein
VEIGEEIGKIGSSGQSSSPHLHFSVNMERFKSEELATNIDGLHGLGSLDGTEEQKEEIGRAWAQEKHYSSTSVDPFYSWKGKGSNTNFSLWYDQCGLPIYPDDDRKARSVQVRPEPAPEAYGSWSQSVACGHSGQVPCNIEPAQEYPLDPALLKRMGGSCAKKFSPWIHRDWGDFPTFDEWLKAEDVDGGGVITRQAEDVDGDGVITRLDWKLFFGLTAPEITEVLDVINIIPQGLQDKIDGTDPSPYTKKDLSIMVTAVQDNLPSF